MLLFFGSCKIRRLIRSRSLGSPETGSGCYGLMRQDSYMSQVYLAHNPAYMAEGLPYSADWSSFSTVLSPT
jgi:hypothetical protein